MAEQEYRYQGPPSGITLPGAGDDAPREELLTAGRTLRLPADDARVAELVARGHLVAASAEADDEMNRETENL